MSTSNKTEIPSPNRKRERPDDDEKDEAEDGTAEDGNRHTISEKMKEPYYEEGSQLWYWHCPPWGELIMEEPDYHPPTWQENQKKINDEFELAPVVFHVNDSYTKTESYKYSETSPPLPSKELIERARRVSDRHQQIQHKKRIAQALWDDWHGDFPRNKSSSRMWWTGAFETEVPKQYDKDLPYRCRKTSMPRSVDELQATIRITSMEFFEPGTFGCGESMETPGFWVDTECDPFEYEHGVGAYFGEDCQTVVDLDYSYLASH